MKENSGFCFFDKVNKNRGFQPISAHLSLTYFCNLDCIHCYCKGSEDKKKELDTRRWFEIIDDIKKQGCIYLIFSGGESLIRKDFLEIYNYAKKSGFLITIFTNGLLLKGKILGHLARSAPYSIDITLNGITQKTYESITQKKGSFSEVIRNIKEVNKKNIPLRIKSNFLKQNKDEIAGIKAFVEEALGTGRAKFHFAYDPVIHPRLNGDKTPCDFRLDFREMEEARCGDSEIWQQYQRELHGRIPELSRNNKSLLYLCRSWMRQFFIDPYGILRFCALSDKFDVDLKTSSIKGGLAQTFSKIKDARFRTDSKCRDCSLRLICYNCPARAYLETCDEEAPVEYYCELAKATQEEMHFAIAKRGVSAP